MIDKNEIYCLRTKEKGSFFEEYLVCIETTASKKVFFGLRAMKKSLITQSSTDEQLVIFELMIRSRIRHPFLVNQVCAFQDYDNLYYVTDNAPVKLLNSKILPKIFSVEIAKFYIAEIFLCLKYMHKKEQNYTFLCPENIFLGTDGHIKLDYSFCNCLEYNNNGLLDNIEYTSVDYIDNKMFSYLSDYWSMGIVFYRMILGYTPFSGKSLPETIANMRSGDFYLPDTFDDSTKSFLSLLLDSKMFHSRPSCQELEDTILRHPIFADIDWGMLENKSIPPPYIVKHPDYDLKMFPKLSTLYTSDFIAGDKDGYGNIFSSYNSVHFLLKK